MDAKGRTWCDRPTVPGIYRVRYLDGTERKVRVHADTIKHWAKAGPRGTHLAAPIWWGPIDGRI